MSDSFSMLVYQKRLRSCDSFKINIQSDDEKEKREKMQDADGKVKNMNTAPVFLEKKKKERLNNNKKNEKKAQTYDYKEGKKKTYNEVQNTKASPISFEKEKRKEKLKVSCSKKNMKTDEEVGEEEVEIWIDHNKSKRRKVSTVSYDREERRKRSSNANCGMKIHSNADEREDNCMLNYDFKIKDEEGTATSFDKENKKRRPTDINSGTKWLQTGVEEEEKQLRNLDCKIRNRESSATFFKKGKERKSLNSTNSEKKFQIADKKHEYNVQNGHYKVKSRKVSAASYLKGKKKMLSHDNVDRKINGAAKNTSIWFSKNMMQNNTGKKRTEPSTYTVNEKKMRPHESTEMEMQHDLKQKKRNVPSDTSKGKKMKAPIDCNFEKREREESNTLFKKVKRMQSDDNKKIHSGKVNENNCGDGDEKKRNTPFSFFKVICNKFKESLSIPPKVAPELEDLTNRHVYLEDAEGKISKIRLSIVDGFLAFHQGWNIFVSDHLIKLGEFLLFEYTARSTFSVRIFGRDSRERLHFDIKRKSEGFKKKEMHTIRSHDDFYFSGEYPRSKEPQSHRVTVHTTEDPKITECMLGSGPEPLDTRNGDEVIRPLSSLCSKEKSVILITDSGSLIHENDIVEVELMTSTENDIVEVELMTSTENDIVELMTSTADLDTQDVAADTKKDPKMVQNGTQIKHSIDGKGTCAFIELQPAVPIKNLSTPDRISSCGDSRAEVNDDIGGKGTMAQLETDMGYLEPIGSIVDIQLTNILLCTNNTAARQSGHCFSEQKDTNSVDLFTPAKPEVLTPVYPEILESDDQSVLKIKMQFCIPNTTRKWLELPKSLSSAVRGRKQHQNIIMLKDPMKRLWPVLYHENSIFVGFTAGWKHFAAANSIQVGDLCELFEEAGDEEPVYSVQITKQ